MQVHLGHRTEVNVNVSLMLLLFLLLLLKLTQFQGASTAGERTTAWAAAHLVSWLWRFLPLFNSHSACPLGLTGSVVDAPEVV
eukprot:CAMPEP_0182568334 /NCGR_PEP_ID=MMETSP1324-20130603/9313_1 /TAXON_ID=236786 /ORGANISM="Florenciella sp., Strain RCC1587" /LENGTH=82 /DNA_ID=CAMNT_0024782465 /DNA_START=68 /DNA_END=316 /DNA_ORIENTATION=+